MVPCILAAERRNRVAKRGDWKTTEMPEKNTTIELNVGFTEEDMKRIKRGVIPEQMEDKWFKYYEESENKYYIHRSWTGNLIYVVTFEKDEDGYVAVDVVVNRDPSQYRNENDESDRRQCLAHMGKW